MSWRKTITTDTPQETIPETAGWKSSIKSDTSEEVGALEGFGSGLQSGTALGFRDELAGLSGALGGLAGGDSRSFGEIYDEAKAEEQAKELRIARDAPIASGVGTVVGGALPALLGMPPGLGANATLGAKVAQGAASGLKSGAVLGGIQGLGDSEADDLTGTLEDVASAAGTGGLIGGGLGGALPFLLGGGIKATGDLVKKGVSKVGDAIADTQMGRDFNFSKGFTERTGLRGQSSAGRRLAEEEVSELVSGIGNEFEGAALKKLESAQKKLTDVYKGLVKTSQSGASAHKEALDELVNNAYQASTPEKARQIVEEARALMAKAETFMPEERKAIDTAIKMFDDLAGGPATKNLKISQQRTTTTPTSDIGEELAPLTTERYKVSGKDVTSAELQDLMQQAQEVVPEGASISDLVSTKGMSKTITDKSAATVTNEISKTSNVQDLMKAHKLVKDQIEKTRGTPAQKLWLEIVDSIEGKILTPAQQEEAKLLRRSVAESLELKEKVLKDFSKTESSANWSDEAKKIFNSTELSDKQRVENLQKLIETASQDKKAGAAAVAEIRDAIAAESKVQANIKKLVPAADTRVPNLFPEIEKAASEFAPGDIGAAGSDRLAFLKQAMDEAQGAGAFDKAVPKIEEISNLRRMQGLSDPLKSRVTGSADVGQNVEKIGFTSLLGGGPSIPSYLGGWTGAVTKNISKKGALSAAGVLTNTSPTALQTLANKAASTGNATLSALLETAANNSNSITRNAALFSISQSPELKKALDELEE